MSRVIILHSQSKGFQVSIRFAALLVLTGLVISGCGKSTNRSTTYSPSGASPHQPAKMQSLDQVLAEVKDLQPPQGVEPRLFADLKVQFEWLLIARGVDKFPSKPPSGDPNNTITLVPTGTGFTWNEARWGDWTNDGTVSATDLGPLASHFGASSDPVDPNFWLYAGYIDGNSDGFVNAGDLSAIAFHFGESTKEYHIYESSDLNGVGAVWVATIERPSLTPDPNNPPWGVSLATLTYDTSVLNPPWNPVPNSYYRVIPADSQGNESTDVSSSGWVQYPSSQPPTAMLSASPLSGNAPLDVFFWSSGSQDPDGLITLYEIDYTDDGIYDESNAFGQWNHTYGTAGIYTAKLRVTDDSGLTATDTVVITVQQGLPVAVANSDVSAGPPPLTVNFSSAGSFDPDGAIVLYEWDYESDGTYDFSDPGSGDTQHIYNAEGNYTATLRVTDNDGLTGTDLIPIIVSGANIPPMAVAEALRTTGAVPFIVDFIASNSNDPDGSIVLYEWDFETDGTYDYSDPNTGDGQNTYPIEGSYTATLRVTDNLGASGTDTIDITVTPAAWVHTWGTSGWDRADSMAFDSSDNVYLAGYTGEGAGGLSDGLVMKYSNDGNLQWVKSWGGSQYEYLYAIEFAGPDSIYLTGYTSSFSDQGLLLNYDLDGNLQWAKTYALWGSWLEDLKLNGAFLYGVGSNSDFIISKYDLSGNFIWGKSWDSSGYEAAPKLAIDLNGNLVVAGTIQGVVPGLNEVVTLKLDADGNLLWAKSWDGADDDFSYCVTIDSSGNIYVGGETQSFGGGYTDALLLKYDSSGNLQWARTWGLTEGEYVNAVAIDYNGNLVAAAVTRSFLVATDELLLLTYDPNGNLLSARSRGNAGSPSYPYDIGFDSRANLFVCGVKPNNLGDWNDRVAIQDSPVGNETVFSFSSTDLTATESNVTGTEDSPTGIEDTGGGIQDAFIMRNIP